MRLNLFIKNVKEIHIFFIRGTFFFSKAPP